MKLDFIALDRLSVSKTNMRYAKRAPDVADILPSVRRRGVIQPVKGNKDAVAETIENNIRAKIIKECLTDPAFYDKMSKLLDEIIAARKAKAMEYEKYLQGLAELVATLGKGEEGGRPSTIKTEGQRALYNNLDHDDVTALRIDEAVKGMRQADWRGVPAREQEIKAAIYGVVKDVGKTEAIFAIIFHQREY